MRAAIGLGARECATPRIDPHRAPCRNQAGAIAAVTARIALTAANVAASVGNDAKQLALDPA